ncbi:MAG TPA: hypothetical protein VLD61_09620 [Methylomirabilota bacterium]|nr:hypothetical protein [Methylomirabilota bacterium]
MKALVGIALAVITGLLPVRAGGQAILQALVLDLSVLEVQVIVSGARPDDELRCLLRGAGGHPREAARQRVSAGSASGPASVVSLPLPLLDPGEREFAVHLVRGETVLARTTWRPLAPSR